MTRTKPNFPVLRLIPGFWGTKVLAIYDTYLISGQCFLKWSGFITEEMCYATGEEDLRACLRSFIRLDFIDIAKINEEVNRQSSSFTLETRTGKPLQFAIPVTQAGTIRAAFSAKLPGRFVDRDAPSVWQKLGELLKDNRAQSSIKRVKQKPPAYSKLRGWSFKILGVVYWMLLASPLMDRLPKGLIESNPYSWVIWIPVPLLIYHGYQLCQKRYVPESNHDTRRPILFLRSFEDDSTTSLQPTGLLAALTGVRPIRSLDQWFENRRLLDVLINLDMLSINNPIRLLRMIIDHGVNTSEESLVRFFEKYGPVLAIGKPGEELATPGSQRVYLDDEQWQSFVSDELQRSQAIILQPGSTFGIKWELEQVRRLVAPYRVLLCLARYWRNAQEYEELANLAMNTFGVALPRVVPYLGRPAFIYFENDWIPRLQELSYRCPALWAITADAADLGYSLYPFLEGLHGGERETPRIPRWSDGFRTWASKFAGLLLALVVLVVPVSAAHFAIQALAGKFFAKTQEPPAQQTQELPAQQIAEEQQIPEVVARSMRITLRGHTVPYEFEIPEALLKVAPDDKAIEYFCKSPDGRLLLKVLALNQQEDLSNLPQQLLAQEHIAQKPSDDIEDIKLDSVRSVQQAGIDWKEAIIAINGKSVPTVREIARGSSGRWGTIVVTVAFAEFPESATTYRKVAEEILDSFRIIGKPSG